MVWIPVTNLIFASVLMSVTVNGFLHSAFSCILSIAPQSDAISSFSCWFSLLSLAVSWTSEATTLFLSEQALQGSPLSHAKTKSNQDPYNQLVYSTVDLMLLQDADYDIVPRQAPKVLLIEHGYYIIGVQFRKEINAVEVKQKIRESYQSIIPEAVEVQLCTSVNSKIVRPSITPWSITRGQNR